MAQKEIELILVRQLASYLAMPIFIVDAGGNLLFYNEPAERLLGRRYEETGPMSVEEWAAIWEPTSDEEGQPLPPESLPLFIALSQRLPAHRNMRIRSLDGIERRIAVTAFPLDGQGGRHLGAVTIFWELE